MWAKHLHGPALGAAFALASIFVGVACATSTTGNDATVDNGSDASPPSATPTTDGTAPINGKTLAATLKCGDCHTSGAGEMAGSTTPVKGTQTYGSNLTPDKATGIGAWTDAQIATSIREARDQNGNTLCDSMPAYPQLSDAALAALVAYLRGLPAVKNAVPDSVCPPLKNGNAPADDGSAPPPPPDDASPPPPPDDAAPPPDDATPPPLDAGADTGICGQYVDPTVDAGCTCKAKDAAACQPNGCYGGYYCFVGPTPNQCWASKPLGCP